MKPGIPYDTWVRMELFVVFKGRKTRHNRHKFQDNRTPRGKANADSLRQSRRSCLSTGFCRQFLVLYIWRFFRYNNYVLKKNSIYVDRFLHLFILCSTNKFYRPERNGHTHGINLLVYWPAAVDRYSGYSGEEQGYGLGVYDPYGLDRPFVCGIYAVLGS